MIQLSPQDLASQFELYAKGWEDDATRRRARYAEHKDWTVPGNREIALWENVHYVEADQAVHQLRNAARMVREFLVPQWTALQEGRTHLTAELVRMTHNACGVCRQLQSDPIPLPMAQDAQFALDVLDKHGDREQVEKWTALTYTREDVRAALGREPAP